MNKEAIVNKLTAVIEQIKENIAPTVVKDYSISPYFDMKSGEESGLFITFVGGPHFVFDEALLNYWKEQLEANDFKFQYYRYSPYLTFFVDYMKGE